MIEPTHLSAAFPKLSDIELLSQGGQKTVFAACHQQHGRVALKILHRSDERFDREVATVRRLGLPNVPSVFEFGNVVLGSVTHPYLIEQLVSGECLRDVLNTRRLSAAEVVGLLGDILQVISQLEIHRVVHRDIKPDNILIDGHGRFWLLDFGIVRDLDLTSLTATMQMRGPATIGYSAPEQLRNDKQQIDSRADLFALGVTAYESVSGTNPYLHQAQTVEDVFWNLDNVKPPLLELDVACFGDLAAFIDLLMRPRVSHRPPSAADANAWLVQIRSQSSN